MRHISCIRTVLLPACVLAALLSPFPCLAPAAQAAIVNYGSTDGTHDHVTGNHGKTNGTLPAQNLGAASGNTVNVTGGAVNLIIAGGRHDVTSGNGSATASGNQVNISTFTGSPDTLVHGGYALTV